MGTKLFVCCHKEGSLSKVDGISTIKVGADLPGRDFCADYSDNDGENISAKNLTYNELTAIYWAWKNYDKIGAPESIGFMHYRRSFLFDARVADSVVKTSCPEGAFLEKSGYCDVKLDNIMSMCDFVSARPCVRRSVRSQYVSSHGEDSLDFMVKILKEKSPKYSDICDKYLKSKNCYFFNMFIFPKDIFFEYCAFVFPILEEVANRFPNERLFVSERLTGIFITALIESGKVCTYLPVVFRDGNGENAFKRFANDVISHKGIRGFFAAIFHLFGGRHGERRRI